MSRNSVIQVCSEGACIQWRIEGEGKGTSIGPYNCLMFSKLEVADQQGVVNSRS